MKKVLIVLAAAVLMVSFSSCKESETKNENESKRETGSKQEPVYIETFDGPCEESKAYLAKACEQLKQITWPPVEKTAEFRKLLDSIPVQVPEGTVVESVESGPVPMEWVYAKNTPPGKVVLYLHGGAYAVESAKSRRPVEAQISAAAGVRVLSIDYRMAPENPFPAALEDAKRAYKWLLEKGHKPDSIALAGDSAGGGLAIATMLALRDEKARLPCAAVLLSPWTDLTLQAESIAKNKNTDIPLSIKWIGEMAKAYAGKRDLAHPLLSPLYSDPKGLPPLLVQAATTEMIVDDSTGFAEKAKKAGVDVRLQLFKGMWHVFQAEGNNLPESKKAISEIAEFLKNHLG